MCYTSGTTGRPKGVLYSHRSIVLHTLGAALPDSMDIREADSVMPVVPMFHAMAWGLPYIAAMVGARLVLPGPDLTPRGLADLIEAEGVTMSAGVPTIWNGVLGLDPAPDLSSLRVLKAGGAAVPESLIRGFDERFGVPVVQGWGMTETSPLAATSRVPAGVDPTSDEGYALRATVGRVLPLIDFRVDQDAGGELQVRGPWIARAYYEDASGDDKFTDDGWLRTGDVAEVERGSYVKLVDRTKDLVKSGGEWISSVELENAIMAHPDVIEAAVIAVPGRALGRAALRLRRPAGGLPDRRRGPSGAPRRPGRQVVDPGAIRVHRRGAQDLGRQVRQEGAAGAVRGRPGAPRLTTRLSPGSLAVAPPPPNACSRYRNRNGGGPLPCPERRSDLQTGQLD